MLAVYLTIPNSNFISHLAGIFVGLFLKFCGLYIILPRSMWIEIFEDRFSSCLNYFQIFGYLKLENENIIDKDFDSYFWIQIYKLIRKIVFKLRYWLFGYEYIEDPPEPIECPNSIEMNEII